MSDKEIKCKINAVYGKFSFPINAVYGKFSFPPSFFEDKVEIFNKKELIHRYDISSCYPWSITNVFNIKNDSTKTNK